MPDPVLSFGYFGEEVQTRVGPQERRFGLRQKIPWPGTLGLRGEAMFEATRAAFQKYEAFRLRLHYNVKRAYYEYYLLGREIQIMHENVELLNYWESVVRIKYQAGLRRHPDVIKAQVELGKLDDRLATLEHKTEPVVAKLRAELDLPEDVVLPVPVEITESYRPLDEQAVRTQVVANNPNLRSLDHLADRAEVAERLASKASLPNFILGFDYVETSEAIMPNVDGSGADPWMVSVGISLPLWFGKNSARRKEAAAGHRSSRYRRLDAENRLIAAVERILFEYEDANRKVRLYKNGLIPKGGEQLEAAYTAYQAGQADFLNLIDAQRQLLSFQLEYERGLTARATRLAELQMLTNNEEL
jgi:outer membrane protein TolC